MEGVCDFCLNSIEELELLHRTPRKEQVHNGEGDSARMIKPMKLKSHLEKCNSRKVTLNETDVQMLFPELRQSRRLNYRSDRKNTDFVSPRDVAAIQKEFRAKNYFEDKSKDVYPRNRMPFPHESESSVSNMKESLTDLESDFTVVTLDKKAKCQSSDEFVSLEHKTSSERNFEESRFETTSAKDYSGHNSDHKSITKRNSEQEEVNTNAMSTHENGRDVIQNKLSKMEENQLGAKKENAAENENDDDNDDDDDDDNDVKIGNSEQGDVEGNRKCVKDDSLSKNTCNNIDRDTLKGIKDSSSCSTKMTDMTNRYESLPHLIDLSEDAHDYSEIKERFITGYKKATKRDALVEKIERIKHDYLEERFHIKEQFLTDNKIDPNIKDLWHDSKPCYGDSIDYRGIHKLWFLKLSNTNEKDNSKHTPPPGSSKSEESDKGEHLFFTVEPWETKIDHGQKRIMYLAKVITGYPKEAKAEDDIGKQLPEIKDEEKNEIFHSLQVPNAIKSKQIDGYLIDVVDQALPVYKITYNLSENSSFWQWLRATLLWCRM